jgi:hypothetical protein
MTFIGLQSCAYNYLYFNKEQHLCIKISDNSVSDFSLNNHICVSQASFFMTVFIGILVL